VAEGKIDVSAAMATADPDDAQVDDPEVVTHLCDWEYGNERVAYWSHRLETAPKFACRSPITEGHAVLGRIQTDLHHRLWR